MFISDYRRADTVSVQGMILSTVQVSPGEGDGFGPAEVANTLSADRDSIDGILFRGSGSDALEIDGIHRLMREVIPSRMRTILETEGRYPSRLDDLVGAGYVGTVSFILRSSPSHEQVRSLDLARNGDCDFHVTLFLSPEGFTAEEAKRLTDMLRGAVRITLRRPEGTGKRYRKNELMPLARSLRDAARDVKVY